MRVSEKIEDEGLDHYYHLPYVKKENKIEIITNVNKEIPF